MGLNLTRQRQGALAVTPHAQFQRLDAAQQQEGIKCRQHGTGHVFKTNGPYGHHVISGANDRAGNQIAVAAEILSH